MSKGGKRAVERIHAARRALARAYGDAPWFVGTGIVPQPGDAGEAGGLGLRLVVDPDDGPAADEVPASFEGFPLEVVRRPRYLPRSENS